ncbi:MAG: cell division/cell wall cluster transcriptional repressor MraZ [candidate division WOR-3 bacterium]
MNRNNRLNSVDAKGRVSFPVFLRKKLGKKIILTKGYDPCIYVYSQEEWKLFIERIKKDWALYDIEKRKTVREIIGIHQEVEFDTYGRILLPGGLMEYAGIKDKCLFISMPRWIEIWNPERYEEYQKDVIEKIQKGIINMEGFPL